jgi:hypothetical protein
MIPGEGEVQMEIEHEPMAKECPFCEGRNIEVEEDDWGRPCATCKTCGAMGPPCFDADGLGGKTKALELWNSRKFVCFDGTSER